MIRVGDDVTLNGKVVDIAFFDTQPHLYWIKLNSGLKMWVLESDINTFRPHMEVSDTDMRKGE